MTSLIGADREKALEVVRLALETLTERTGPEGTGSGGIGVLVAANFLSPVQVAISGSVEALDAADGILKEVGIRRGVRLKVAGAFHSPLMEEGGKKLRAELEKVEFKVPKIPFASNVTGRFCEDPKGIRENLGSQVTSPVLWSDTMTHLIEQGVTRFFEPGPGKVLAALMKKVDRSAETFNADAPEELEAFAAGFTE